MKLIDDARELLLKVIRNKLRDAPDKRQYMTTVSLGHQYLQPLWEVCNELKAQRDYSKRLHKALGDTLGMMDEYSYRQTVEGHNNIIDLLQDDKRNPALRRG